MLCDHDRLPTGRMRCALAMTVVERIALAASILLPPLLPSAADAFDVAPVSTEPITVTSTTKVRAVAVDTDGTTFVGGQAEIEAGTCGPRADAFVEQHGTDDSILWRRDGRSGTGGGSLFDAPGGIDPDFVTTSTVYDMELTSDGALIVTGDVLLTWRDAADAPVSARGAFVVRLAKDGTPQGEVYLGAEPTGPPAFTADCPALCTGLAQVTGERFGARAVALGDRGIFVTGWHAPRLGDENLFLAAFSADLGVERWRVAPRNLGNDTGLDLGVAADGRIFVTGVTGVNRDVFIARFADTATGVLEKAVIEGGVDDDEGRELRLEGGQVTVEGIFTGTADFGGTILNDGGAGQGRFVATYDLNLNLLTASSTITARPASPIILEPFGLDPSMMGGHEHIPIRLDVPTGKLGTGGPDQLVGADDETVHIYGVSPADAAKSRIVLETAFEVDPAAPILRFVRIVLSSEHCSTVRISVASSASDAVHELGTVDLCPYEGPTLKVKIPPTVATSLGFAGDALPPSELLVRIELDLALEGLTKCNTCGSTPGEDSSVDEIILTTDYP